MLNSEGMKSRANKRSTSETLGGFNDQRIIPGLASGDARLGITQARVSDIKRVKFGQYSLDMLVRLASRAGLKPRLKFAA